MTDKLESIVRCPSCGAEVRVELEKQELMIDYAKLIGDDSKSDRFGCLSVCKCGGKIFVSLQITVMEGCTEEAV